MAEYKHIFTSWEKHNYPKEEIKSLLERPSFPYIGIVISIIGYISDEDIDYFHREGINCIRTFDEKTFFLLKEEKYEIPN